MSKRVPYIVKVRCILNGADTTKLLYLLDQIDALGTMRRYVPKRERQHIRLLACRHATEDEVRAHVAACEF